MAIDMVAPGVGAVPDKPPGAITTETVPFLSDVANPDQPSGKVICMPVLGSTNLPLALVLAGADWA